MRSEMPTNIIAVQGTDGNICQGGNETTNVENSFKKSGLNNLDRLETKERGTEG